MREKTIQRQAQAVLFLFLLLSTSASASASAGGEGATSGRFAAPIVNGTPTTGSPATVLLADPAGNGFCSGTLISPRTVLTARHCLGLPKAADYRVFFGSEQGGQGTTIEVVHVAKNPDGDIGVMTLKEVGPTEPVPIYAGALSMHLNQPVHEVGFGVTSEMGSDFGLKREGTSTLTRVDGDSMITDTTVSGTCNGDSGGSIYMTIDGHEVLAGVVSSGTDVCGSGEDINVRTDTYAAWIKAYVDLHETGACQVDGVCNDECPGYPGGDPDCSGCDFGDTCRADCPHLDFDCCASDGMCFAACGIADEDCPRSSAPDAGPGPGADQPGGSGGCTVSAGRVASRATIGLMGVLVVLGLVVRRRRGSRRQA